MKFALKLDCLVKNNNIYILESGKYYQGDNVVILDYFGKKQIDGQRDYGKSDDKLEDESWQDVYRLMRVEDQLDGI